MTIKKVAAIMDTNFALDGGAMFGVVPKTLWSRTNPADNLNRIDLAMRTTYIELGNRKILIDTGIGHKNDEKFDKMFKVQRNQNLIFNLEELSIHVDEITDIIITHLHFDHAGGNTTLDDSGKLIPTFKNATYHVQKDNFNHALNPGSREKASYLRENFIPIQESGQLNLIDGNQTLFNEIELIPQYGHTIGQQLVKFNFNNNTYLYMADTIPTSSHINIPFVMGYDIQPLITMEEKNILLKQAVDEDWILLYEHDPNVIGSKVIFDGRKYKKGEIFMDLD
jgi:glyoxylase-like metal-dependent hydrolase (beta-lactamase superfamily II)